MPWRKLLYAWKKVNYLIPIRHKKKMQCINFELHIPTWSQRLQSLWKKEYLGFLSKSFGHDTNLLGFFYVTLSICYQWRFLIGNLEGKSLGAYISMNFYIIACSKS